ncbi:MAG: lysine transporter LysE [Actinobacteria bacterium HGW-Actinobacteria-6]|nr:MAG: lysine transporter LysE [Actinobacteria bacterium HGW-Actinobacteria-6]
MSAGFALLARTFVIGILVAAPVGAMGVLCIQRTLGRGAQAGLATGLGIASADGLYAAIAAFGLSALSSALVAWQTPLRLVGGAVLVYLGVRAMLTQPKTVACASSDPLDGRGVAALYTSAVGLTLTNPMTIMAFGAVFASAGLAAQPGLGTAAVATAGVASGSLAWWIALVTVSSLARARVGDKVLAGVSRVSGALVAVFGLIAIVAGLAG